MLGSPEHELPPDERPFEFPCPYCQSSVEAQASWTGRVAPCPHCKNPITIPSSATARPQTAAVPRPSQPPPVQQTQPVPKTKRKTSPAVWVVLLLIAAIVGTVIYRKSAAKKQYIAALENVLREANSVSVATGRGVNKQEFIDAYKTVTYDWSRKEFGPGSSNSEFGPIQSHIRDAINAWDAVENWEIKDGYHDGGIPEGFHLGQAIRLLPDAIGRDNYNLLDRDAEAQGSSEFPENLVRSGNTAASSHVTCRDCYEQTPAITATANNNGRSRARSEPRKLTVRQ